MSFVDFWTDNNNPALPKSEYLYNARHIFVLILTLVLCISLSLIFKKRVKKQNKYCFMFLVEYFYFSK